MILEHPFITGENVPQDELLSLTAMETLNDLVARAKRIQTTSATSANSSDGYTGANTEDSHRSSYDTFISYRVSTDKDLAHSLSEKIEDDVEVYLDAKCLEDGEEWQKGFLNGLFNSTMMVPVMSWIEDDQGIVGQMLKLDTQKGAVDNVLLEWELALALYDHKDSKLTNIYPVFSGGAQEDGHKYKPLPWSSINLLENKPALKVRSELNCIDTILNCLLLTSPLPI